MVPWLPQPVAQKPSRDGELKSSVRNKIIRVRSNLRAGHAIMSEQQPETEYWFSENIQNSISNNFCVDTDNSATFGQTPDATQYISLKIVIDNWRILHRVDCPENQSEACNCSIEGLCLVVLGCYSGTTVPANLIDNCNVCNACNGVPSPFLALVMAVGSKAASNDHNEICNNCNKDVGSVQTCQKRKVEEEKWSSESPVNITCPIDFSIDNM